MKGYTYPGKSPIKVEVIGTTESGAPELSDPNIPLSEGVERPSGGVIGWLQRLNPKYDKWKRSKKLSKSITSARRTAYSGRV